MGVYILDGPLPLARMSAGSGMRLRLVRAQDGGERGGSGVVWLYARRTGAGSEKCGRNTQRPTSGCGTDVISEPGAALNRSNLPFFPGFPTTCFAAAFSPRGRKLSQTIHDIDMRDRGR
ncbi:hypothetical protein ANO11243_042320 [Dothideomycetidae sp. 11243]|nr:hypothetical protein ANO11243_042320 [fungal sp. No.11243]